MAGGRAASKSRRARAACVAVAGALAIAAALVCVAGLGDQDTGTEGGTGVGMSISHKATAPVPTFMQGPEVGKSAACVTYYLVKDGTCAEACLDDSIGICPRSVVVKAGGLTEGDCSSQGYTTAAGTNSQKAGPCGTLVFKLYTKPSPALDLGATAPSTELGTVFTAELEGLLPMWTYSDPSACLQTRYNYAALWISEKGAGIDGVHTGTLGSGKTCSELGYIHEGGLEDLPPVIRALYTGVTMWEKPHPLTRQNAVRDLSTLMDKTKAGEEGGEVPLPRLTRTNAVWDLHSVKQN